MPDYDFRCNNPECDVEFSFYMHRHDEMYPDCIECHGPVRRLIGTGGTFILKGGGWYGKAMGQSTPLKNRKK